MINQGSRGNERGRFRFPPRWNSRTNYEMTLANWTEKTADAERRKPSIVAGVSSVSDDLIASHVINYEIN